MKQLLTNIFFPPQAGKNMQIACWEAEVCIRFHISKMEHDSAWRFAMRLNGRMNAPEME